MSGQFPVSTNPTLEPSINTDLKDVQRYQQNAAALCPKPINMAIMQSEQGPNLNHMLSSQSKLNPKGTALAPTQLSAQTNFHLNDR